MSLDERRRSRRAGACLVALSLAAAIVALYAVHGRTLVRNPLQLPLEAAVNAAIFLPQGWAFFTRDPRAADPQFFERHDGRWQPPADQPTARAVNLFGASRVGRSRYVELGRLLTRVADDKWQACDGDPVACFDGAAAVNLKNDVVHPRVCGDIAVSRSRPVPWAWSSTQKTVHMPARVVRLRVRC